MLSLPLSILQCGMGTGQNFPTQYRIVPNLFNFTSSPSPRNHVVMIKRFFLLIFLTTAVFFSLGLGLQRLQAQTPTPPLSCTNPTPQLKLNEFMAVNATTITDQAGEFEDWVEIYNMGTTQASLQNLYITDDLADLTKFQITQVVTIPACGVTLLWADGHLNQGANHIDIGLSANGEDLAIVAADGTTILDSTTFTAQTADISQARIPDGTGDFQSDNTPTPNQLNLQPPTIVSVLLSPAFPTSSDPLQITAEITDDMAVVTTTLFFRLNNGSWSNLNMVTVGSNLYRATIPAQPNNTIVDYYVYTADNEGLFTQSQTYSIIIGYTRPPLVLNEFMASNQTTWEFPAGSGVYPDWIEIHNTSTAPVSLDNLYLTDDLLDRTKYAIPDGLTVPAEGFVLFYTADPISSTPPADLPYYTGFGLSANGDNLALYGAGGADQIDFYSFTSAETDVSQGRRPDAGAWQILDIATPGRTNTLEAPTISHITRTPEYPTAGQTVTVTAVITDDSAVTSAALTYSVNEQFTTTLTMSEINTTTHLYQAVLPAQTDGDVVRYTIQAIDDDPQGGFVRTTPLAGYIVGDEPVQLYLNEFMVNNSSTISDSNGLFPGWIELYNPHPFPVNLDGFYLTDDVNEPTKLALSADLTIAPHDFIIFWTGEPPTTTPPAELPYYTDFKLDPSGEDVLLFTSLGFVELSGVKNYSALPADVSRGLTADGFEPYITFAPPTYEPTPGRTNDQDAPIIANITFFPTLPAGDEPVQMTVTVTDNGTISQTSVVYSADGQNHAAVTLTAASANQFVGTLPGFPHHSVVTFYLLAEDTAGNVQRAPSSDPNDLLYFGVYTPPGVVVNEMMADNGNTWPDPQEPFEYPDWIELYNNSDTAVSLDGFYLSDSATQRNKYPIPASVSIAPHGYLMFLADNEPHQGALHTNFTLPKTGGNVYLTTYISRGSYVIQVEVQAAAYDYQLFDTSTGRYPHGTGPLRPFIEGSSPNAENYLNYPTVSNAGAVPFPDQPLVIYATVTNGDNPAADLASVVLYYSVDNSPNFQPVPMARVGTTNRYRATLSSYPAGTTISYYIEALDRDDLLTLSPTDPSQPYTITVGAFQTIFLPTVRRP